MVAGRVSDRVRRKNGGYFGLAGESPNIMLILTDDQGWSQTSLETDPRVPAFVSQYLETPNMSRLAKVCPAKDRADED